MRLQSCTVATRPSRRHRTWRVEAKFRRYKGRDTRPIAEAPIPDDLEAEALQRIIDGIKVDLGQEEP